MKIFLALLCQLALILQSCGHSAPLDLIEGKKLSRTGATTDSNVRCLLRPRKSNPETIEGQIIVQKDYLDLGINLATWKDSQLFASWSIQPSEKEGAQHFHFIIHRSLIPEARLDLFTKEHGMKVLMLRDVRILKAR